jgi:glutamine---fructose-6-phosphate transaminase (isomerizing)
MAKEIAEQPDVVGHTLAEYLDFGQGQVRLPEGLDFAPLERLTITACGTAFFAGLVARYWFEKLARLPVEADIASEFRYREAPLPDNGLAIVISQSGETADTLAALRYCKSQGQLTAGVVNVAQSTIARDCDVALQTFAGPEIGVASTKAFTCQLAVLASLAIAAGRARGTISRDDETRLVNALAQVPRHMSSILAGEKAIAGDRPAPRPRPRRALPGARHELSVGARRRAQAEGDLLYPRRRLCCGRTQARAHRADRRGRAGGGHRAA